LKDRLMGIELLPKYIREHYEVHEWKHACAILKHDFPEEWNDVVNVLSNFKLCKTWITTPGGGKSKISQAIDSSLYERGWRERMFHTSVIVDSEEMDSPTHKVDCYKNKIALEIEWNNKDPFYDRDLNNFRLLFDLRVISVGIIVTRCDELQQLVVELGRAAQSYGQSTTHMSKLIPKIQGGGSGGCPLLVFGISRKLFDERC